MINNQYQILDGKKIATNIKKNIADTISKLKNSPVLAIVHIEHNQASTVYTKGIKKLCNDVGAMALYYPMSFATTENELLDLINTLNQSSKINGIIIQMPLPNHINKKTIAKKIAWHKDLDCINPYNIGLLATGDMSGFIPCTPLSVVTILDTYNIDVSGKHCVMIGRSNVVGRPMANFLLARNATVSMCHSCTEDLANIVRQGDIVICAVGKANFLKADMIKNNAVVMDVGINISDDGKLVGDVCFDTVKKKASFITPVPGGVGALTSIMLINNLIKACNIAEQL